MKVALVTGSNKGIGFEIVKQLAEKDFKVYLSARSIQNGLLAVNRLKKLGLEVSFLNIDVSSETSIRQAALQFGTHEKQLDVLVNNAGILVDKGKISDLKVDVLQKTINVNAIGAMLVTQHFLNYLKPGSRIINISSGLGSLNDMSDYSPAYSISKTMLNAITRQFAANLASKDIAVNAMCPGWVKTDMGGISATREVYKGAETAIWLAIEAFQGITGSFFRDKREIEW